MGSKSPGVPPSSTKDLSIPIEDYQRWRAVIFMIRPEQVDVPPDAANRVYGVIMDIGLVDSHTSAHWAISLTAFPTGEASFHPTPGGAVIGLGNDPQMNRSAKEIVQMAQSLLPETSAAGDFALPTPGMVQFFFLTTGGTRVIRDRLDKMQQPGNAFAPLLTRFGLIRRFADRVLQDKATRGKRDDEKRG